MRKLPPLRRLVSIYLRRPALSVVCVCLLCLGFGCSGDDYEIYTSIVGTVTDYDSGEPLSNAAVVLSPTHLSCQTDSSGEFVFENLDAQQYTITVQKSGFQPNRKTVDAISGERMAVSIQLTKIP